MPELPEVETVVRTLEAQIQGETISYCEVRWDKMIENVPVQVFEKEMKNQTFYQFKRKGKYLIFELSDVIWVAHMRMEGKFYVTRDDSLINKHVHMILALEDGRKLLYHDTRKFGKMNIYIRKRNHCYV